MFLHGIIWIPAKNKLDSSKEKFEFQQGANLDSDNFWKVYVNIHSPAGK